MFPIHPWFCPMQEWMWWWRLQADYYTSMRREPSIWTESPIWWWTRQTASCKAPWRKNSGRYIHSLLQVYIVYHTFIKQKSRVRVCMYIFLQYQFLFFGKMLVLHSRVCVKMHCLGHENTPNNSLFVIFTYSLCL